MTERIINVESILKEQGFRNIELLSQGANGYVYQANNKIVKVGKRATNYSRNSSRREYGIMKNLYNRGVNFIPRVYKYFEPHGIPMYSMNMVGKQSLYEWFGTKPSLKSIESVYKTLVGYIYILRRFGINHGDLHPGNIRIGPGLKVTLIDFGRVRHANNKIIGTRPHTVAVCKGWACTLMYNNSGATNNMNAVTKIFRQMYSPS